MLKEKIKKCADELTDKEKQTIESAIVDAPHARYSNIDMKQLYTELYIMRHKLNIPPSEMAVFYCNKRGLSKRSIQERLLKAGWQYDKFEAQSISAKKKDYGAIARKSLETIIGNNYKSNTENYAREMLNLKLNEAIEHDVIVGVGNRDIIPPYEIDIPIIICCDNKILRYAVEFNGYIWHKERQCKDAIKAAMMVNAGYKPFTIIQHSCSNKADIDKQIDTIVKSIKKDVDRAGCWSR